MAVPKARPPRPLDSRGTALLRKGQTTRALALVVKAKLEAVASRSTKNQSSQLQMHLRQGSSPLLQLDSGSKRS